MATAIVGLLQLSRAFAARSSPTHSATWFHATLFPLGANVGVAAIFATTSSPLVTRPSTTFCPSRLGTGAGPVVIRNSVCAELRLKLAPSPSPVAAASASETVPGRRCFCSNDAAASSSGLGGNRGAWTWPMRALPAWPASTYRPGFTRWNTVPLYPRPGGASTSSRKCDTAFGTRSPYRPISTRPSDVGSAHRPPAPPSARSARTIEGHVPMSRNTRWVIRGGSAASTAPDEAEVDARSAAPATREARLPSTRVSSVASASMSRAWTRVSRRGAHRAQRATDEPPSTRRRRSGWAAVEGSGRATLATLAMSDLGGHGRHRRAFVQIHPS